MTDKMANEIVIPSCSNYEVTDTELITGKNRKRELSISESEFEYNDHTDLSKCETSTNKKNPCKDNQSSAICKSRISEQSLSDVIQKLTKQIEQIEKEVALSQNFMRNTKVNDEPIYQPPNKIIKYDVEVISAESCNSDENNIRSTKNVNTTKHVNKKIKLDKNISFQKDVSDDSERDCKSLTNEEVEVLLELPYNFDDKIIFDNEDNTHIKIHDGQTNEKNRFVCKDDVIFFETEIISNSNKIISQNSEDDRNDFNEKVLDKEKLTGLNCGKSVISVTDNKISINDSVSIPEHADKLNMSMEHVFNESMLNSNKIGFSTEDQIVSVSNDCSENIINQSEGIHFSEIEVNGDEVLETRACEDNADNSSDAKSIHQDGLLDLTKGEHYEIAPYRGKCTSIINEGIKCKSVTFNNQIKSSLVKLCNSKNKTISINKLNESDYYEEETVEEIIEQTIEDIMVSLDSSNSFCFGIINLSKNIKDFENILEPVDNYCMNSESLTNQEKICLVLPHESKKTESEIYKSNNNIDTSSKSISNKKLIEVKEDDEKISDYDNTTDKIIHSVNIPDLADTLNTSIKHLFNESILDSTKIDISTDDKSMSQSNDCSESSINQSLEYVNVGEVLALVPEMNDDNVDNCDPESIDQDDLLDLTNCENDEIMLNHENCTSIINNGINSTMPFVNVNFETQIDCEETTHCSGDSIHETDFERIIVPEGKLNDSTKHVDDQEYVCEIRSDQEKNNFEPSNIEDDLFGVHIVDFHSKVNCENNINQRDLLDINAYANNQTMLENKNNTLKMIPGQKNESTLKRLTVQEEEIRTELFNNDVDELGRVTDCTDTVTTSQTCEDYIYENVSKKFKNQDDLLEVTLHISDENTSLTSEEKRSDQPVKHNTLGNYENDDTIFNNEEINISTERCLSFNSSDARRILESSGDGSEHLDDSLLFKPSDRDLFRYGIECEEYENSISQSLNNLENNVGNKEVIPHCKSPSLKFNEISKTINNFVSSSYVKDYEDNVIDFYDCDLSSIENSDVEDNLLLSFENDSSIDDCIFNEKGDKLKNATNSTSNEQTCKNSLKIQNVGSPSESRNNLTNVETPVSLIHSPSHEHQNNKIMSTSISMKQMGMNPDTDDKLESFNHSDVKIAACNTVHSINESNNINRIDSDDLCKDQGELKSNFNEDQNLEVLYENHNQNNENKTYSEYNTHQNIEKSLSPYKDSGFESSKVSSVKNTENEEITKINTVKSTSSDINQSEIEKKKYLDEIIKNEQLLNNFDEKLDVNESIVSPYISQSLAKSTNLKSALAKKAAANINIRDMGDKALSTYLTQQTMTLDVLKVLHKSLDTCPSSGVLMEDPEGLVVPLMPHQKHAIAWLIWRESQEPRGGILADDMGLGKTLSMISLILKLKEKLQDSLLPLEESIDNKRNDFIIGGTLVICPASLINQWETEVKTKLKPGLLKVGQYYGINRNFSALELAENDLVITSYHVVMWDHKIRQNSSPLYKIKWDRVILDEGHNIRNHKTQTSVAVCNIKSLNRWAITGTPIHNKEADFFTLLKFVRCKPFDDWPVWKRWVGNNDDAGKHRLSLLVKTLMLRRTKTELTQFTTFNLPVKKIITIEIELSKEERNAYEKLLLFSSNLFATYLYDRAAKEKLFDPSIKVQCKVQYFQEQSQDKDKVFKDHPELLKLFKQFKNIDEIQTYHILVLLLRLRQMCCHPILIKGPITEESIKKEDNMESIPEDDIDATYNDSCNENKDIDTSPNNIDLSDLMSCLTLEDEPVKIKSVVDRNIFQKTYVSSKIKKICDLVNQKILINGGNDKAIIVSQWPSFLYLIKKNLAHYNAKIEMFSGAIPIQKRNKIIRDFNNPDEGPQILLLSLKAGGVGLNLMAANHMFLIDVHWNPQLEAQACDRVYRVGQIKPVYIYKFISNNTIETRILNIQTLKLQIAENLFKGTSVASSKITIDDLKQIFQFH